MRFGRLNLRSAENEPFAAFRRTQTTTPSLTATLPSLCARPSGNGFLRFAPCLLALPLPAFALK